MNTLKTMKQYCRGIKNRNRRQNKMNEVLFSIEYLLRSLTWKDAVVFGIALVGVFVVCRLLKAKKDKIEEKLDERKK